MITIESHPLILPPNLQAIYDEAKATYNAAKHAEALSINENLYDQSTAEKSCMGRIIGKRFMGLCQYRLSALEASRASFLAALELAEDAEEIEQQLLIKNHLAATLRRLGLLQQAYDILEHGLEMAPLEQYTHAHARLLGNMGSLLDELGQRAAADDCYARFEVLSRLLGNQHRLANAVGLAARSAELRSDLDTAEKKYRQEADLAIKVKDPLRRIAATVHLARMAARRGQVAEAEQGFKDALAAARHVEHEKRLTDALEEYAKFLREQRKLPEAHRLLLEALQICKEPEKVANVNHALALVCRDAGLYGESLEYLMRSVDARGKLYEPLRTLKDLAKVRLNELKVITNDLVEEAFMVSRSPDVEAKLTELVNKVNDDPAAWPRFVAETESRVHGSTWKRTEALKSASHALWTQRLLPGDFTSLSASSQQTLERAERSYSNAVDDLGRSAHLLALVIECELRERLFARIHPHSPGRPAKKWMLMEMLDKLRSSLPPGSAPPPNPIYHLLHHHIQQHHLIVARICDAFDVITPLDGNTFDIVELRNGVAHGTETVLASLGRLQVDALKRHLALTAPHQGLTIFQALARLDRLP